ncbi:MAG: hypothetical protein K2X72_05690 [Reyranella sp.]|nr:hypothetical protein [Reyranella sp.]
MMQLSPWIQEYVAFARKVPGELVRDDEMRLNAAGVRARDVIGQGLQSLMRFRRGMRSREQQRVVRGSAQPLE